MLLKSRACAEAIKQGYLLWPPRRHVHIEPCACAEAVEESYLLWPLRNDVPNHESNHAATQYDLAMLAKSGCFLQCELAMPAELFDSQYLD